MSASTGLDLIWPAEPKARALATELYSSVAERPLVSVHNGLPARFLAEDLPITDPIGLLVSHDQGVQALLRAHGIRAEFSPVEGWQSERASRQAFALLWKHLAETRAKPWVARESDGIAPGADLPPDAGQQPDEVYDLLAARLASAPLYPRRVLAAADLARFATSDEPADDLQAHRVLAEDPTWAGRVVPTFSPDRYLDPSRRGWPVDAELLAEITGHGTEDLSGFLSALQQRRIYFRDRGATAAEHHAGDVDIVRLPPRKADELYRLGRSGELLPGEALALQGHLLWEAAKMSAEDGLVMAIYPPAGFRAARERVAAPPSRAVADRIRPVLDDFGSAARFRLRLFTIDAGVFADEILPVAAAHPAVTAVPPTRFADDPGVLRRVRVAAVRSVGSARSLGIVDDMSGPFALAARHRLGRRLDAGALAELVLDGQLGAEQAQAELLHAVQQAGTEVSAGSDRSTPG